MSRGQKIGAVAAFINAAVSVATLVVAFGLIGLPALVDNQKLVALALTNPTPLIIQDVLKFVAAAMAVALIAALFQRSSGDAPALVGVATVCGSLGVLCLLTNAGLSLFLMSQTTGSVYISADTSHRLIGMVGQLGLAVIVLNGVWYLLISWSALKHHRLPKRLGYLGLGMGLLSLVPPLGILVLLSSVVWSLWLGSVLARADFHPAGPSARALGVDAHLVEQPRS